jgi:hypothetical protein
MEKVFKILAVFALLMLVIVYSFRSKERKFREYYFLRRIGIPSGRPDWTLFAATIITGEEEGRRADDGEGQLSFHAGKPEGGMRPGEAARAGSEGAGEEGRGMPLIVTDQATGLTIATVPLTESIDGLLFAPETKLIYCCSREGVLTIIRQNNRQDYTILQRLSIPKGGSQLALDIRTHNLYIYAGESVLICANA